MIIRDEFVYFSVKLLFKTRFKKIQELPKSKAHTKIYYSIFFIENFIKIEIRLLKHFS